MTTNILDLTPFGFTPTESSVYLELSRLGPSSGYAVAKATSLARANAYQSLNGLVAKGAAVVQPGQPQRYRALEPEALLALLTRRQVAKLDRLQEELGALGAAGEPDTFGVRGERAIRELVQRMAARSPEPVTCLASAGLIRALLPVWRKRSADGFRTELRVIGEPPASFPLALGEPVPEARLAHYFGGPASVVVTSRSALLADWGEPPEGIWSSSPLVVGSIRAAADALTK